VGLGGWVGLGGCIRSALRREYVRTGNADEPGGHDEVESSQMKDQEATQAAPFGSGKRRVYSTRRLFTGVGLILAATFVLGFYFPVVNASEKQTEQVTALAAEYRLATEAFEKTSAQLASTQAKRDELKGNLNKIDQAESSAKSALEALHASVEQALKLYADRRLLKVEKRKDHTAVIVEALY